MRTLSDLSKDATPDEIAQAFKKMESAEETRDLLNKSALGVSALSYAKAAERRKQRYVISRVVQQLNFEAGIRVFSLEEMMKQSKNNSSFELDHVFPQSADPGIENGNSIGNLVLLGAPLNRELQASLPLSRIKVNAYIASNNVFNYAVSLESTDNLPNSQKQVVDRIRVEWAKAFVELFGPEYRDRPIAELVSRWDEQAVQSVSRLYWNLFRSGLSYI
jgi:hypothetical protein